MTGFATTDDRHRADSPLDLPAQRVAIVADETDTAPAPVERVDRFDYERRLRADTAVPWRVRAFGLLLATYMDRDGGNCRPGLPLLMELLGEDGKAASKRTVLRYYDELRRAGYLVVVEAPAPRRPAVYAAAAPTPTGVTQVAPDELATGATQVTPVDPNGCQSETERVPIRDTRTSYKTKKTTTTRACDDAVARPLVQILDGGGGNEEQDHRTDVTATAAGVVGKLPDVLRLGDLDRTQLVPAIAGVLHDPRWTPEALTRELSRDLPGAVHSGLGFVRYRLDNLPPPPAAVAVAAAPAKPWCGSCHSPDYRWRVDDDDRPLGKCKKCHPAYVATASA